VPRRVSKRERRAQFVPIRPPALSLFITDGALDAIESTGLQTGVTPDTTRQCETRKFDSTHPQLFILEIFMYRHFLVPIDNTGLSIVTIAQAVEFARTLGARITFFHAQANHFSTLPSNSELSHPASPDGLFYNFEGRTKELLTKAESAARAQGVPCSSSTVVSDVPHSAILATARAEGCDLIFMASHSRNNAVGKMPGSQTLNVLAGTEIPVLVSPTVILPATAQVIATIQEEHRSLAAVLHAWLFLLKSSETQGTAADANVMRAMVHYIQAFPHARHHPTEQQYLFRKLRERTSVVNPELDELERQHERDEQLLTALAALVEQYAASAVTTREIETAVSGYAKFTWEHMGREEGVILPAAQRFLTEKDWSEINSAFSENQDPRFGDDTDAGFRRLFLRIANLDSASNQ
jgi:nucleotide-binding universal stress UspA family protein/hemerythrin-like domain-containing protein